MTDQELIAAYTNGDSPRGIEGLRSVEAAVRAEVVKRLRERAKEAQQRAFAADLRNDIMSWKHNSEEQRRYEWAADTIESEARGGR